MVASFRSQYAVKAPKLQRSKLQVRKSEIAGSGVFASQQIPAATVIIEYVGELVRPHVADKREQEYTQEGKEMYFFKLDEERIIDATCAGSISRLINHSCDPNAFSLTVQTDADDPASNKVRVMHGTAAALTNQLRPGIPHMQILIIAKRAIEPGEEVSYDYYTSPGEYTQRCKCGAENCRGYL